MVKFVWIDGHYSRTKINKRDAENEKKKNSSQVQGLNYVFIPILHDNFYFCSSAAFVLLSAYENYGFGGSWFELTGR